MGAVFLAIPVILLSSAGVIDTKLYYLCIVFYAVFIIACIVIETIFMNTSKSALYDPDIAEEYDAPLLIAAKYIDDLSFNIIIIAVLILVGGLPVLFTSIPPYILLIAAVPLYVIALIVKTLSETNKYYDIKGNGQVKKTLTKTAVIFSAITGGFFLLLIALYLITVLLKGPGNYIIAFSGYLNVISFLATNGMGIFYVIKRKKILKPYGKLKRID